MLLTVVRYQLLFFVCFVSCDLADLCMVQSVRVSVRLPVTHFSLCSHHRIINFSGAITNDRSDAHAKCLRPKVKGQGQNPIVPFPDHNFNLNSHVVMK